MAAPAWQVMAAAIAMAASLASADPSAACGEGAACVAPSKGAVSLQVKASGNEGRETVDVSLPTPTPKVDKAARLLMPQGNRKLRSGILHLQEMVLGVAADSSGDGTPPNPHANKTAEFVAVVTGLLDELRAGLLSFNNVSRSLVERSHAEFGLCDAQTADSGLDQLDATFKAKQGLHKSCLPEEDRLLEDAQACRSQVDLLKVLKKDKCDLLDSVTQAAPRVQLCADTSGETYKQWLARNSDTLAKLTRQYSEHEAACDNATQAIPPAEAACVLVEVAARDKESECRRLGAEMDTASCTAATSRQSTCEQHSSCHSQATTAYNTAVDAERTEVVEFKHDWAVLEHIGCIVKVLTEDATGKQDRVQACHALEVNASHLDIHFPPVPPQAPCPPPTTLPCTADYVAAEYGTRRDRCTWCPRFEPTTTTTVTTTVETCPYLTAIAESCESLGKECGACGCAIVKTASSIFERSHAVKGKDGKIIHRGTFVVQFDQKTLAKVAENFNYYTDMEGLATALASVPSGTIVAVATVDEPFQVWKGDVGSRVNSLLQSMGMPPPNGGVLPPEWKAAYAGVGVAGCQAAGACPPWTGSEYQGRYDTRATYSPSC